jgi:hypothetical protein
VVAPAAEPFDDGRGAMLAVAGAARVSGAGAVAGPGLLAWTGADGRATPSSELGADAGGLLATVATTGGDVGAGGCGRSATVGGAGGRGDSSIVETGGLRFGVDSTGRGGSTTRVGGGMTRLGAGDGVTFGGGVGSGLTGSGSAATSAIGITTSARVDHVRPMVNASQSRPACKSDDETIGTTHDES